MESIKSYKGPHSIGSSFHTAQGRLNHGIYFSGTIRRQKAQKDPMQTTPTNSGLPAIPNPFLCPNC